MRKMSIIARMRCRQTSCGNAEREAEGPIATVALDLTPTTIPTTTHPAIHTDKSRKTTMSGIAAGDR